MTPAGVGLLKAMGHNCYVEQNAGLGAGFSDLDYEHEEHGSSTLPLELFARASLILKVARPTIEEIDMLREGSILMGFQHLAVERRERIDTLLQKKSLLLRTIWCRPTTERFPCRRRSVRPPAA